MAHSNYSLCWEGYKGVICDGFSSLQHNSEFVDMTLAADGHLVKVHQIILALASPYFKELIVSAPCQHPVIFLNNVSHSTLCSILEYIYTGQVVVQSGNISTFLETAKALHIRGLNEMKDLDYSSAPAAMQVDSEPLHAPIVESLNMNSALEKGLKKIDVKYGETRDSIFVPSAANKISIKPKQFSPSVEIDYSNDSDGFADSDQPDVTDPTVEVTAVVPHKTKNETKLQFTVSNRGYLQVILNRYVYSLHSKATRTGTRRWRCVEYRNNKCTAFLTTKGNIVLNRANLHNHPYHDKKILQKIENNAVYSAMEEVKGVKSSPNTAEIFDTI